MLLARAFAFPASLLVGSLAVGTAARAQDNYPDPTFAPGSLLGGWNRCYFGTSDEKTIGLARASSVPDAGFVLAVSIPVSPSSQRVGLFRLDRNGNTISSRTDYGVVFTTVNAMTVDASGRIIVAGSRPGSAGAGDFAVARFNADGSIDGGFGVGGVATHTFELEGNTGYAEASRGVIADADGKIVVVGDVNAPGFPNFFGLFRLTAGGALDTTFGDIYANGGLAGSLGRFIGTQDAYASSVLKVASGQYVVVGTSTFSSTDTDFAARLYLPTGSPSSNSEGAITLPVDEPGPGGSLYDNANAAVAADPLTVVVVGTASGHAAARRFKLTGLSGGDYGSLSNDTSFIGNRFGGSPNRYVASYVGTWGLGVGMRPNGDIQIVGRYDNGQQLGSLIRLNPDGTPDLDFSATDGLAVLASPTSAGAGSWYTELTQVLFDGAQAVVAGHAVDNTTQVLDFDGVVTRLQSDLIFANGFQ